MRSFLKYLGVGLVGMFLGVGVPVLADQLIQDRLHVRDVITSSNTITSGSTTAITAGGNLLMGHCFSTTAAFCIFAGSGAPTITAAKGSLYLRSDGSSSSTRAYINTDGAATWVGVTTGS